MTVLNNGAPTIQRSAILDAIKALAHTSKSLTAIAQGDVYLLAYQEGFNAALVALALVIGAGAEVKEEARL